MTAASGILHKEYHEKEWSKTGGAFQMVQLWVNLPAQYKMSAPKYQGIKHDKFGQYLLPNSQGVVEVIAGDYNGTKGPASTFTPIEMYNVRIKKGANVIFSLPEDFNTGFMVIEGTAIINDKTVHADHFVLFANKGTDIILEAPEDTVVLVLSGKPIEEPIVPYGPFLMNYKEEIMQAYEDLNNGKFGHLED